MALKPVYGPQRDKNGNVIRDAAGGPIPHKKAGKPMPEREWSDQDKKKFQDAVAFDKSARQRAAQQTLEPIQDAQAMLCGSK